MEKLLVLLGATVGGWVGWAAGQHFGMYGAVVLSAVGTGLGLYMGRRIARDHF